MQNQLKVMIFMKNMKIHDLFASAGLFQKENPFSQRAHLWELAR